MSQVLVLSHTDVMAALTEQQCADAMREVLSAHARGETFMPLRSLMAPPEAKGYMGLMPAWRGGQPDVFALKAICLMPGNPERGLDAHQGTVTLFDGETGVPTAILDASAVTEIRTAAVSAVATDALARRDARVLAIIGAGVQARAHLKALRRVRDFEEVRVYSRSESHAARLEASVASSAQEAVRDADVIVTATNSREPVIRRDWLAPGVHINAIGASTISASEIDTATVADCALFADSRESLRHEAGEFQLAIEEGLISGEEHVRGELGEVLVGLVSGRLSDDEITVFRSLGLAVEDLAAAVRAVANARLRGLGREVEI